MYCASVLRRVSRLYGFVLYCVFFFFTWRRCIGVAIVFYTCTYLCNLSDLCLVRCRSNWSCWNDDWYHMTQLWNSNFAVCTVIGTHPLNFRNTCFNYKRYFGSFIIFIKVSPLILSEFYKILNFRYGGMVSGWWKWLAGSLAKYASSITTRLPIEWWLMRDIRDSIGL